MTRFLFVRTVCFKIHALFKVCISLFLAFKVGSHGIEASWAGGKDGREVKIDKIKNHS